MNESGVWPQLQQFQLVSFVYVHHHQRHNRLASNQWSLPNQIPASDLSGIPELSTRNRVSGSPSALLPTYACAILRNDRGELLLERRPVSAVFAGGQWTCFGGRREKGEEPEAALRRELREELGWEPATLQWAVELWVGGELIAWFYEALCNLEITDLRLEPGRGAGWLNHKDRQTRPLSPWHAAVLEAWEAGRRRVDVSR